MCIFYFWRQMVVMTKKKLQAVTSQFLESPLVTFRDKSRDYHPPPLRAWRNFMNVPWNGLQYINVLHRHSLKEKRKCKSRDVSKQSKQNRPEMVTTISPIWLKLISRVVYGSNKNSPKGYWKMRSLLATWNFKSFHKFERRAEIIYFINSF